MSQECGAGVRRPRTASSRVVRDDDAALERSLKLRNRNPQDADAQVGHRILRRRFVGHGSSALRRSDNDVVREALRSAIALEDDGKYAEAAAQYRQIVTAHPDSVVAWTDLGNAESQLGHGTAAEEAFRKALELDPNSRDALNNLAWLLYQQKRLDEAESFARQAV